MPQDSNINRPCGRPVSDKYVRMYFNTLYNKTVYGFIEHSTITQRITNGK